MEKVEKVCEKVWGGNKCEKVGEAREGREGREGSKFPKKGEQKTPKRVEKAEKVEEVENSTSDPGPATERCAHPTLNKNLTTLPPRPPPTLATPCSMIFYISIFVQLILETLNPRNYLLETSDSRHTKSKMKPLGVKSAKDGEASHIRARTG